MSGTLKAAITALKGRIAAAYSAISAKGGTLPATQDSASLPTAIASIPSGGGGAYDYLKELGVTDADIAIPNACVEDDVELSKASIQDQYKTYVKVANIPSNYFYHATEKKTVEIVVADTWTGDKYQPFFDQRALRTIIVGGGVYNISENIGYYCFFNCVSLRNLFCIWNIPDGHGIYVNSQGLQNVTALREVRFKNININTNLSTYTGLSHTSLLFAINNLKETQATLTIGTANMNKLTVEEIAIATQKGWTIQ